MKDLEKYLRIIATITFIIALSVFSLDMHMRTDLKNDSDTSSTKAATNGYTFNSNEESQTMLTRSGAKCLTFDETFDDLVASSNNIFITMPAKAAGSTMKTFARKCVGQFGEDNMLNRPGIFEETFMNKGAKQAPSIIASHIANDIFFTNLVKNIPHTSLVLYIYRDETERLMSAIKQVVVTKACNHLQGLDLTQKDGSRCIMNEKDLVQKLIKQKFGEIGVGASNIMTCGFYDAMEENFPQMVFVNYKQADRIQEVLAKYHCPNLLDNPIHNNVAGDKKTEAFLKLDSTGEEIALEDWLELNRDMLEFMFQLDATQTCKAKTLSMQDDLLGCEDEMLQVTRETSFRK